MKALALVLLLGLVGCDQAPATETGVGGSPIASAPASTPAPAPKEPEPAAVPPPDRDLPTIPQPPPPVTLRTPGGPIELRAWTYCFGNGCVDGMPPAQPPDVGLTDHVLFDFPLAGWDFEATFEMVGFHCPRRQTAPAVQVAEQSYVVEPAGFAGAYDVILFGRGAGGDLVVTFRWLTTRDGMMPVPEARLALIADHDGRPDSYGTELELRGLASTPASATAEITVTAESGESHSFEPARLEGCWGEGVVYWEAPPAEGLKAIELGPAPYTYDVAVVLDGVRYTATANWPDDQIVGDEPSVRLDFSPALPALP